MGGKELLIVAIVRMHRSTKDVWCVLFTDCQKKSALPPRLNERTLQYSPSSDLAVFLGLKMILTHHHACRARLSLERTRDKCIDRSKHILHIEDVAFTIW